MMQSASSAKLLSLVLTVFGSTLGAGCAEDGVLELFPGKDMEPCALFGAGGAPDGANGADACALGDALAHRYSFNSLGAIADDTVGGENGSIVNTRVGFAGELELAGTDSDQYVDLPNGLISGLKDATFEAWLEWNGGRSWQRIFDFGNSYEGEDLQGGGFTYLFLTPSDLYDSLRLAYSLAGADEETVADAQAELPAGSVSHVVAVIDDTNDTMSVYLDGSRKASVAWTGELGAISDVNNWLGRSQFLVDDELAGTLYEFRIYRAALTQAQIAVSYAAGPDPDFLDSN